MVSSSSSTNKKERPTRTTKHTKQSNSVSRLTTCSICREDSKKFIPCDDCSEQFCSKCWEKNMDINPLKPCLSVNCSFRVNQLFLKRNKFHPKFVHKWSEREKSKRLDVEKNLMSKMLKNNENNNKNNKNIAVSSTSKFKTKVVLTLDCPVCPSKPKVDPEHCVFFTNNLETTVCNKTICNVCLTIKDGEEHQCKEDDKNNAIQLLEDTTQCPKCDILIQKTEGCNQMKCHRCGANFDFVTGTLQQRNVELMGRDRDLNLWTSHHESTEDDLVKFVENSVKNEQIDTAMITYLENNKDVHKILYEDNVMEILTTKVSKMGITKNKLVTLKELLLKKVSELLNNFPFVATIVSGLYRILFVNDVESILDAERIVYFVMSAYYEEFNGTDISDSVYQELIFGVHFVLLQTFESSNVKPKQFNAAWISNFVNGKDFDMEIESVQRSSTTNSDSYISNSSTSSVMMSPITSSASGSNIYNDLIDFFDNGEEENLTVRDSLSSTRQIVDVNRRMQEESTSSVERRPFSGNNIGTFVRQILPENPFTILRNRGIMRQQSNAQTLSTDSLLIYRRGRNYVSNFPYRLANNSRFDILKYNSIFISYFMDKYENIVYFIFGKMIFVIDLSSNVCLNVCMFDNKSSVKYEILNVKKFNGTYTMLLRFANNYNAITRVVFQGQSFLKEGSHEILLSNIQAIVKGHTRKDSVMIVINAKIFEYSWNILFDQSNFQPEKHGKFLYDVPLSVKHDIKKLKSVYISHKNLLLFQFTDHCEITKYNIIWTTMKFVDSSGVLNVCFSPTGKYVIIVRRRSNGTIIHQIMDMESYEIISRIQFIHTSADLKWDYTDIYFQDDLVYFHYISGLNAYDTYNNTKKYARIDLKDVINATNNSLRKRYDSLNFLKKGKEYEASPYALFFAERESILDIAVNDYKLDALGVPFIAKISSNSLKALCNIARNVEYLNSNWGSKQLDIHSINSDLRTNYSTKLNQEKVPIKIRLDRIETEFLRECEKNFRKYEMNVCKFKLFRKIKSRIAGILSMYKNSLIADGMICLQSIKSVEDDANQELEVINKFYNSGKKLYVDFLALNVQDIYCSQTYLRSERPKLLSFCWQTSTNQKKKS